MKNTFRILLAFALAFIALHSAAALEAKVLSTSGKVEIQKGSAWVPLNTGDVRHEILRRQTAHAPALS
ncbi:MAG: hypothetical protein II077_11625, partial [Treponema sp.]|nr:hypothetical protein [Treponema sp.]